MMQPTALLFAGQGAQSAGMGRWICVAIQCKMLLDIYAKNEKEDLSAAELKLLRTLVKDY
jgi:malonyl CoA-acyl carrier protein transacylase